MLACGTAAAPNTFAYATNLSSDSHQQPLTKLLPLSPASFTQMYSALSCPRPSLPPQIYFSLRAGLPQVALKAAEKASDAVQQRNTGTGGVLGVRLYV